MKICEITDRNFVYSTIMELDLKFEEEFSLVRDVAEAVIRVGHRNKYDATLDLIERFRRRAESFFNINFPDFDDPDVLQIKNEIREMLGHLAEYERLLHNSRR